MINYKPKLATVHSFRVQPNSLRGSQVQFVSFFSFFSKIWFLCVCVFPLGQGDARYLISNSKDQSIKLWDIRKFSPKEGLAASRLAVTHQNWDYRWQQVPPKGEEGRD